ncbi:hypothetical protein [Methylibium sp.]|uniref:hypothetical protein n=1 Tax=Methylibium sp. TaxID=2067992 RepID=UPI003D101F41
MHSRNGTAADLRIYGGALDAPGGGFLAAVVVMQVRGIQGEVTVVMRDESLSGGYRFKDAAAALRFAMDVGMKAARQSAQPVFS